MRTRTILAMAVALWPLAAHAVELDLGLGTEAVYDTNVFRSGGDSKGDGSFRFTPSIRIVESYEKLDLELRYRPIYEAFTTYTGANAFSHNLSNRIDYRLSPKTEIELSNLFRVQQVLNYGESDTIDEGTTPIPDTDLGRDTVIRNDTRFNLTRAISARWLAKTDVGFNLFDPYERRNSVGSKTVSAFQTFNYQMNRSNQFGLGGGAVIQMFGSAEGLPANNSYIYRLFGTYQRMFGESTTLTLQLGPAFIVTKQGNAQGQQSDTFPFIPVDHDTTVGDLIASGIGIDFGFGQGLTPDTVVPAGSVVVPDPIECNSPYPGVVTLLEGDQCEMQLVLRNDPNFPKEFAAIDDVRGSETKVTVQGSNAGTDDTAVSLFGDVSLAHNWTPNLYSQISYNRSESTPAGQGATAIADSVSFFTQWYPDPLWDVSMRASYVKRESPTNLSRTFLQVTRDATPDSDTNGLVMLNGFSTYVEDEGVVDTERVDVAVRAARRLTRHVTVSGRLGYGWQRSGGPDRIPNDYSDFTAMLGFKYDFDPFRL